MAISQKGKMLKRISQLILVPLGMLKDILKYEENIPSGKASFPRWRSKWGPARLKRLYLNRKIIQMIFHLILVPRHCYGHTISHLCEVSGETVLCGGLRGVLATSRPQGTHPGGGPVLVSHPACEPIKK